MSSLQLQSKYADHLSAEAIQLHHRGTVFEVAPGTGKNAYHCGYYFFITSGLIIHRNPVLTRIYLILLVYFCYAHS